MNIFMNKETDFFKLFSEGVSLSLRAAGQLKASFSNGSINAEELSKIKETEHEGDRHVHKCLKLLDDAFITPIDRSDIVEILNQIESTTDSIDMVANNIYMMRISNADSASRRMVELIVEACTRLAELMELLKQFKKNQKKINELIIEINRIEEDGDKLYLSAMREIFVPETDMLTLIRSKTLYDCLENVIDKCEDVADAIEKIIIART